MLRFGLKLASTNDCYLEDAKKLFKEKLFYYIELYIKPNSFDKYIQIWRDLDIPTIIHAPHYLDGLNLAKREKLDSNILMSKEVFKFADELNSKWIIFHPGISGDIKETANQLKLIKDDRTLVENKPYYTILKDNNICNGNSPDEIKYLAEETGVGFCLDMGHAICSANAKKIEPSNYIKDFLKLKPRMFHLTDGDISGTIDQHKHFGEGNYDIKLLLSLIPDNSEITIETEKNFQSNLIDLKRDIEYLEKI